jgi:DNA-binding transcriptional regulator of glucitol operon
MLLHLFVIAVCVTMVWLGHWQWTAAHRHHGDIRNYAYAFQWWAFTGFALLMWWRVVRDYLVPEISEQETEVIADPPRYVGYVPPPSPADTDPERARFNAYLAELDSHDREESR